MDDTSLVIGIQDRRAATVRADSLYTDSGGGQDGDSGGSGGDSEADSGSDNSDGSNG